jgi:hypothetical protein
VVEMYLHKYSTYSSNVVVCSKVRISGSDYFQALDGLIGGLLSYPVFAGPIYCPGIQCEDRRIVTGRGNARGGTYLAYSTCPYMGASGKQGGKRRQPPTTSPSAESATEAVGMRRAQRGS